MKDSIKLIYYTLQSEREAYSTLDLRENPELHTCYATPEAARAAGDAVLKRQLATWGAKLAARKPENEPDAAKRAWDSEKKAACFTETRLKAADIRWEEGRGEWVGRLTLFTETRHRWREVSMKMTVAKDGTATLTYALGKPLPWSAWGHGDGGLYVPPVIGVVVRANSMRFAASHTELAGAFGRSPSPPPRRHTMRTTLVFSTHNLSLATFLSRAVAGLSATTPEAEEIIESLCDAIERNGGNPGRVADDEVMSLLNAKRGNVSAVARELGVARSTVRARAKKAGAL